MDFDRLELDRARQEVLSLKRDISRLQENHLLEVTRLKSKITSQENAYAELEQQLQAFTTKRNKEIQQRSEETKRLEEIRQENGKLRRELAAALDSKMSHLRVPYVSFEQYRELLLVVESYQALVGHDGVSNVEELSRIVEAAKLRVEKMQGAPFVAPASSSAAQSRGTSPSVPAGQAQPPSPKLLTAPSMPLTPAVSSTVRENIVEGGKLVKIISEPPPGSQAPPGAKQWAIHNTTPDTQFIVEFTFGPMTRVEKLGDTEIDGRTYRLNLYPQEKKMFVVGIVNGYKMSIRYGPPDESYTAPSSLTDTDILPLLDRVRNVWRRVPMGTDVSDVALHCTSEGTPFVDIDFVPLSLSVVRTFELGHGEKPPSIFWLQPHEFLPSKVVAELCTDVNPTRIELGSDAEDGWLVSSFAALAENPHTIGKMLEPTSDDDARNGLFSVWLNKHGLWNVVFVDGYFPCKETSHHKGSVTYQLFGARYALIKDTGMDRANLWPVVLEKAMAKCHGSYFSLRHGDVLEALQDFTGFPCERFDWTRDKDTTIFSNVNTALSAAKYGENIVMLATSLSAESDSKMIRSIGLRPHCAYRVLASVAVGQYRMVLIRLAMKPDTTNNALELASRRLQEKWREDANVTRACEQLAMSIPDVESCVWMEWSDVAYYFGGCGVCYYRPRWDDIRIPNRFVKTKPSFMLEVHVSSTTRMFVGVHQKDRRGLVNTDPDHLYGAFLITIVGKSDGGVWDAIAQSHGGTFWRGRDAFLDTRLDANPNPYYIVPRRYSAEGVKDTVVSLHIENRSAVDIVLREVSDEVLNSLRYTPLHKFDASKCESIQSFECQVNRAMHESLVGEWGPPAE